MTEISHEGQIHVGLNIGDDIVDSRNVSVGARGDGEPLQDRVCRLSLYVPLI